MTLFTQITGKSARLTDFTLPRLIYITTSEVEMLHIEYFLKA